jgi:hypothetical protein
MDGLKVIAEENGSYDFVQDIKVLPITGCPTSIEPAIGRIGRGRTAIG